MSPIQLRHRRYGIGGVGNLLPDAALERRRHHADGPHDARHLGNVATARNDRQRRLHAEHVGCRRRRGAGRHRLVDGDRTRHAHDVVKHHLRVGEPPDEFSHLLELDQPSGRHTSPCGDLLRMDGGLTLTRPVMKNRIGLPRRMLPLLPAGQFARGPPARNDDLVRAAGLPANRNHAIHVGAVHRPRRRPTGVRLVHTDGPLHGPATQPARHIRLTQQDAIFQRVKCGEAFGVGLEGDLVSIDFVEAPRERPRLPTTLKPKRNPRAQHKRHVSGERPRHCARVGQRRLAQRTSGIRRDAPPTDQILDRAVGEIAADIRKQRAGHRAQRCSDPRTVEPTDLGRTVRRASRRTADGSSVKPRSVQPHRRGEVHPGLGRVRLEGRIEDITHAPDRRPHPKMTESNRRDGRGAADSPREPAIRQKLARRGRIRDPEPPVELRPGEGDSSHLVARDHAGGAQKLHHELGLVERRTSLVDVAAPCPGMDPEQRNDIDLVAHISVDPIGIIPQRRR